MQIYDSLEMTSETLQLMHDTLCLGSIAESREVSATGGPQDLTSANISANVSRCGDDSPVFMAAKHMHPH